MSGLEHGGSGHRRAGIALALLGTLVGCSPSSADVSDASPSQRDASVVDDAGFASDVNSGGGGGGGENRDSETAFHDSAVDDLDASGETTTDGSGLVDASDDAGIDGSAPDASDAALPALEDLPYVREVVGFAEGSSAGFGQADYPNIVYGPPKGRGTGAGSLDVMSLGVGGEIVLAFGDFAITDGEGPDFIVFENAFWPSNDPSTPFAELAEVSVSEDGSTWHAFPCDDGGNGVGEYTGCAGWTPTLRYDPQLVFPLNPELTGGDAFDLAEVGLARALYVRIRDLATMPGSSNTGGFDLDAVGLVHYGEQP